MALGLCRRGVIERETVFEKERRVACAFGDGGHAVLEIGREIDVQLRIRKRDEVKAFAAVEVPGLHAVGSGLVEEIGPRHLDEADIAGDEGRRPCGLHGLGRAGALLPAADESVLG